MLRYVPGRSSERRRGRHSTSTDQGSARTTSNALHLPAGRPLVYEPERVGTERICSEELEGLLQIEAEASGIGIGNHGWKQVLESDGAVLEQWEPGPDDAESDLLFFRATMNLEGVPLSTALSQMFDPAKRQRWDSSIGSLRCIEGVKVRTNTDEVQSDAVRFQTQQLLGMFPAAECIMWRSLMKQEGGSLAAFLLRNAEVDATTGEIGKDVTNSWGSIVGPVRVRKLVYGHVFRSLDKTNDMKGTRVFTYIQVKVTGALQYAATHLAVNLATGSREEYRHACLAAVGVLKPQVVKHEAEETEFYDISSQCNDDDLVEQSGWDFLGGVLGKLAPQDKKTRKTHRASLRESRKNGSRSSLQAPLRVVQLHRASEVDMNSAAEQSSEEHAPTKFTTDALDRRSRVQRLRERSRASQHDSMAEMSKRLSTVMYERGSAQLEDEAQDIVVEKRDSMAWLSDLVDLRMNLLDTLPEDSAVTPKEPSSTAAGVIYEGGEAESEIETVLIPRVHLTTTTSTNTGASAEVEPDAAVRPILSLSTQQPDLPCELEAEAHGVQVDLHLATDNPAPSPSSAISPGSNTLSPSNAAPRKKFTLPRMSRKPMPKVAETNLPLSARSSGSASSRAHLHVPLAVAQGRETSPSPSLLSSPRSSCYDIYGGEDGTPLSEEIAVAEQFCQERFASPPEVSKVMETTSEHLQIQPKKLLVELCEKEATVTCPNTALSCAGGLEPEPSPEPGPDTPCRSLLPHPSHEYIASAPLVFDIANTDSADEDREQHPNLHVEDESKQVSCPPATRGIVKAQPGGGALAPVQLKDTNTTAASDALLFCSIKEVATVASVVKKVKSKSKTKSDGEHRKSRRKSS